MCLAVPGQILTRHVGRDGVPMARVSLGGVLREVCLAYVPEARLGDYVLVHVGFALTRIDENDASALSESLTTAAEAAIHAAGGRRTVS